MNKRPAKVIEVGGLVFRTVALHNHTYWLNIEPAEGCMWRIVGFRDRDSGFNTLRLQWTRKGTWEDARDEIPEALFRWEELDEHVRLAATMKLDGMAGLETTTGPWPHEEGG